MAGQRVVIVWKAEDTPESLRERYRRQGEGEVRTRLHALWLLRTGWGMEQVAGVVGVHYRTVQRWVGWYRQGGIAEVCARHGGGHGQPAWLSPEQEAVVSEEAAKGAFTTAAEAQRWVAEQFGVTYRPKGIYGLLRRVRCHPKSPVPSIPRLTWKPRKPGKRGCAAALRAAGVTAGEHLAWADEMRVGLVRVVRRVWAPVGVKVRQLVQKLREWRYLVVALEIGTGRLWWCWTDSMRSQATASVVRGWQQNTGLKAVVWDGASSHRSEVVQEIGFPLVQQPAYAPELNPAERFFEELRRVVEGKVYDTLDAKVVAIESELRQWDADPQRVSRLVGWWWITDTLKQLSQSEAFLA